jgi:hypothetical protein
MADAIVGNLRVILTADQTEFNAAMKSAAAQVKTFEKSALETNAKIATTGKGVASTFGNIASMAGRLFPAAAIAAAGMLVKQVIDASGALADLSANTGLSLSALQKFKFGAEQTGSSIDAVVRAVQFGQKAIADGDKSFVGALGQVGLSLAEVRAMKPESFFEEVTSKIAAVQDPAERTALRMALLGRTGRELAGDFKALGNEAQRSGLVLGDDVIKNAEQVGDKFDKLISTGKALVGTVLAPLLPVANATASVLLAIAQGALAVVGAVSDVIGGFLNFLSPVERVREAIQALTTGFELFGIDIGGIASAVREKLAAGFDYLADRLAKVKELLKGQTHEVGDAEASMKRYWQSVNDRASLNVVDVLKDEEKITGELNEQIKKNAEAQDRATEATKRTNEAADTLNRTQDDTIEKLRSMGVMTQEVASKSLAPLIEKLNLAAAAGDQQLRVALINLEPELEDIGQAMRNSGLDTRFLTQMLDELKARAGSLPPVIRSSFDDISSIVHNTFADSTEAVRKAFADMPAIAKVELPKVATEVETFGSFVGDIFSDIRTTAADTFGAMLTGGVGFKDGMLDIWDALRRGVANILSQMLDDFLNGFLKGMLGALTGSQGAFQKAFSGLFPGLGGLIPGLGGGVPGGGFGAGAGIAGSGSYTVGGLPGAAGAPWWSTSLGGGAIGGAAGAGVGWYMGGQTGNTWGSAGAGAATGAGVGTMLGGPIGGLLGGLIGAGVGWYRAKQENIKTNDLRDTELAKLAAQYGLTGGTGTDVGSTFHNIAARLTEAGHGAGGGDLFKQLVTQNDREGFLKALEAVNKALAEYESRTKSAADADAESTAAIQANTAERTKRADALKGEIATIAESVKRWDELEKPEAVMGTIEAEAREKLAAQEATAKAALDALLLEATGTIEEIGEAGKAAAEDGLRVPFFDALGDVRREIAETGRSLDDIFRDRRVRLDIEYPEMPSTPATRGPEIPEFTYGTPNLEALNFGSRGTLARLHNEEFVIPKARKDEFVAKHAGRSEPTNVVNVYVRERLDLDQSRQLAAEIAPYIPHAVAHGGQTYSDWRRMTKGLTK